MSRSPLFLRIFGWFWLALAAMVLSLLGTFYLFDSEILNTRWNTTAGNPLVKPLADEAIHAYREGGRAGLAKYLDTVRDTSPGHVYMFDGAGVELAGQDAPARVREFAAVLKDPARMVMRLSVRHGLVGAAVAEPGSGQRFAFVIELERRPGIVPVPGLGTYAGFTLALVVLGAFCLFIARQLTGPVMRVSAATRRFAAGDLTARSLDSQMAQRNDEFAELAREFDEMAARIETLVHVQERLLWDMSHELRSPLTRMTLALGIARRRAGPEVVPMLDRMEREAEQLNRMIGQLLAIARIKGGARPALDEDVDLAGLVAEVAADADFEAQASGRAVRCGVLPECAVKGSGDLLRSALENVLRNAVRHTAENTAVEVELRREGGLAVIAVRDHGPGVPEAALAKMFETFYRVPEIGETGGAGLGLAITQQAMALHAGWVKARNAEGGGLVVELGIQCSRDADHHDRPTIRAASGNAT